MKPGAGKFIVMGLGLLALIGLGGWLLLRLGNETGSEEFLREATLPRRQAGDDVDAVARELVDRWLRHFTSSEAGWAVRLRDYRIDRVDVTRTDDRLVVSVTLQVKPRRWSFDNWLAGSGGTIEDGWIRGKFTRFALIESSEGYRLRPVGPGPL